MVAFERAGWKGQSLSKYLLAPCWPRDSSAVLTPCWDRTHCELVVGRNDTALILNFLHQNFLSSTCCLSLFFSPLKDYRIVVSSTLNHLSSSPSQNPLMWDSLCTFSVPASLFCFICNHRLDLEHAAIQKMSAFLQCNRQAYLLLTVWI